MKKLVLGVILAAVSSQAVSPSKSMAESAEPQIEQMSKDEQITRLRAAREALGLLEFDLESAQKRDDGRLIVKIRNRSLISAGILGGVAVLSGLAIRVSPYGADKWGGPMMISAMGSIASLVSAGSAQGVMFFTESEASEVKERIKVVKESIARIEAALAK